MTESIDLKSLEKKAYRSVFNDGLWDLFIGMLILNLGVGPLFNHLFESLDLLAPLISSLIWNIIALLIFILGKKYITIPRVGYVKFGPKRKSKQLKLKIFLICVFLVNLILFTLRLTDLIDYNQIQPFLITLFLGFGIFAIPFCVMAYFLDFTRLYFYAFSAGLGFFFVDLLNPIVGNPLGLIITFGVIGGIIIIIGLYYFIHFLKKYPLSKEEVS
ncbi:MAG: hypothetical protein ACFE9Q_13375 [Candidatus Hodarchaeota archaeon]